MKANSVMFIDDDDSFLLLAERACQKSSLSPEAILCLGGNDGINKLMDLILSNNPPELIFVDLNMPSIDGLEFLKIYEDFRQNNSTYDLPLKIYMMTSSSEEIDRKNAIKYGADGFIVKPSQLKDVISIIDEKLELEI